MAFSRTATSERLEIRSGTRSEAGPQRGAMNDPAPTPSVQVAISADGFEASSADALADEADPLDADPRLRLMATMIEFLTGRPVRFLRLDDVMQGSQARGGTPAAGIAIEYESSTTRIEFEQTAFQANGVIRTADGREIAFDLRFAMERSFMESVNINFRAGDAPLKDPLVLDFGGPAASLQNVRFAFDLDADGELDQVPLLGGGRGFLAIDRNDNGRIDDGRELFGPTTGNGFAELAALDADGNDWIDAADPAYAQLRIWQPAAAGKAVVQTLSEANVGALYLANVATPFDLRGASNETLGVMRASSVYVGQDGRVGTVSQIDLNV